MNDKTSFGSGPEGIDRLLAMGLEESDEETCAAASWEHLLERTGGRIGRYKLLRVLGEGGMGVVYLAEQDKPIKRRVALKVIKPGMDSKRVIARFEAERQALALLDHPNIAHVYDAGTTQSGRPYFVMEFVEGLPITEHCDHHKLTIDDRLELFTQICHAVHHAHQKGIIHRDIKPSNILVSIQDDHAVPKIIDFGVAKAISQPLTERTLITEQGRLFGTPEYMSPEQADMADNDIDTRSDIYSLGVLLYVLLTGVLPFDSKELRKSGIEHVRKVIRETDPKTPSTRLTKLGEEAQKIAESRRTQVATLARCLHRELECIPLKAMRKERSERYRSAAELADDIENYLEGRPLIAGPPGTVYRAKKFVGRHKALVTGIAAVLIVLIAGIITSTVFAFRSERARIEAQLISDFLQHDVLESVGVYQRMGQEMTVHYLLDTAVEKLEGKFRDQPLVEASIHHTLGLLYRDINSAKAQKELERAYQIRREHLGPEHRDTIRSIEWIGWIYRDQGRIDDAERLWTEQLEIVKRVYGPEDERATNIMNNLANTYCAQGRTKEGQAMFEEMLEINERVRGNRHLNYYGSLNLACVYKNQGRYEESEQLFLEALEAARQRPLLNRTVVPPFYTSAFADLYRQMGRYEKAEQIFETILKTSSQLFGPEDQITLGILHDLGKLRIDQGRFDQAEPLLREVLESQRRLGDNENGGALGTMNTLAVLLTKQCDYEEANDLLTEVLAVRRKTLGEDRGVALKTKNDLGVLRREQGQYQEAEDILNEALQGLSERLDPDHPVALETMHELAILYIRQARYDEAEPLLVEAVKGRIQKLGEKHPHTIDSIRNLIELYEALNKPEQAEHWRAKLPNNKDTNK